MWNVQAWRWVGRCALWDGEGFRLSETDLRKYFVCQNFDLRKSSKICCLSETDRKKSLEIFCSSETDLRKSSKHLVCHLRKPNNIIYVIYVCQNLIWSESMKYMYLWNKDYWQTSEKCFNFDSESIIMILHPALGGRLREYLLLVISHFLQVILTQKGNVFYILMLTKGYSTMRPSQLIWSGARLIEWI